MEALELAPMKKDKESDYFAMGFRLYDPEIGRFLAIDPLLDVQPSQTPYHYCFNNPTSFTDPTGLYPEKEKGDKVQAMEIDYSVLEEALRQIARDNEASMEAERLFSKWSARMFSAWSYGQYLQFKYSLGGTACNVRLGENGNGSFTYCNSSNGVICNVNFRYNEGSQNPKDVVGMLVGSLNWIANSNQSEFLSMYSKFGFSINVDVSRTGKELGKIFGYKFCGGVSKNDWRYFDAGCPTYPDYNEEEAAKLESGWIYIASEYLDEKYYSKDYSYDIISQTGVLNYDKEYFYNSSMIFSHEFKHNFDSIFMFCPVFHETSARFFTKNIFDYYNSINNFYYYDRHLNKDVKKLY